MKNKYYWAYILNPEEVVKDIFDEKEKISCILIDDGVEKRELFTDAKFYEKEQNSPFDGKIIFEENASLFGSIIREISIEDVVNFIYKSEIDKPEYINLLIKLIEITRRKAVKGYKEYHEYVKYFKKDINKGRRL